MINNSLPCVLLLEDDHDWSEMMRQAFVAAGYAVQSVHTLTDAVQRVSRQRYAALIVDIKLAQQDGEKIIEQVRGKYGTFNAETPILVVSGSLDAKLLQRIAGKVQAVFVKPVAAEQVAQKARNLVAA